MVVNRLDVHVCVLMARTKLDMARLSTLRLKRFRGGLDAETLGIHHRLVDRTLWSRFRRV